MQFIYYIYSFKYFTLSPKGSGSNTPPGRIVPQDIHNQLARQNEYLTYVNSAHELWDQADRLVRTGNHIGQLNRSLFSDTVTKVIFYNYRVYTQVGS